VEARAAQKGLYPKRRFSYTLRVKEIWTGRIAQTTAKYGETAPMATACCNACRTCVQTNAISLALAALIGTGAAVARFGRRLFATSTSSSPGLR
jgi:hypothetical protein